MNESNRWKNFFASPISGWVFWLILIGFYLFGNPKAPPEPYFGSVTKMEVLGEDDKHYDGPIHWKTIRDSYGKKWPILDKDYKHYYIHTKEHSVVEVSKKNFIAVHNGHARQARRLIFIVGFGLLVTYFWRIRPEKRRRRHEEWQRSIIRENPQE